MRRPGSRPSPGQVETRALALLLGPAGLGRPLWAGDVVVCRVAQAPDGHGRGLLSLAGGLQHARLPAWAVQGMTLRLRVLEARGSCLLLAPADPPPRPSRRGRLEARA